MKTDPYVLHKMYIHSLALDMIEKGEMDNAVHELISDLKKNHPERYQELMESELSIRVPGGEQS